MKDVIVIGGPNGAGKTTAANRLLPIALDIHEFLNADEIARGLSPFDPDASAVAAGGVMIERIDQLVAAEKASPSRRPAPDIDKRYYCGNVARSVIE